MSAARIPAPWRVAAWGFAAVFSLGAVVQWNDPDPATWLLASALGTGLSVAAALGRAWRVASGAVAAAYLVAAAWIGQDLGTPPVEAFTSFEMRAASHEAPREVGGLLLLATWTGWLAVLAGRGESERKPDDEQRSP